MFFAIVGLGNPGEEYDKTRHNAGFLTIDALADSWGANYWKEECGALVAHIKNSSLLPTDDYEEILLVKPQSFMNLSGGPVKNICEKYKIDLDHILVIHDDMDIDGGSIRVKRGGSHAGHNGLKSIENKLGSRDYARVRIGIGHAPGKMPVVDYVLQCPRGSSLEDFEHGIQIAADAAKFMLNHTLEDAQQTFNTKNGQH